MFLFLGDESLYSPSNGINPAVHSHNSNQLHSNNHSSATNVPSSQSVQQIVGGNSNGGNIISSVDNNLVPHSHSAHQLGQPAPLTPLAQHQHALHQQLQQHFANVNANNSLGKCSLFTSN